MSTFIFRPPYFISGQEGAALGPLRVPIEEVGISSLNPTFRSMDTDTVQWTSRGNIAPEYLQTVAIWDNSGKRIFTGVCTASDPQWNPSGDTTYRVEISGPWWWLEQAQLTSLDADSTGAESERASFLFPAQDLAVSIRSLIDRMYALGVPLIAGEIDATFEVPQMIFQGDSAASVLRTMLGWMSDAMTSISYDTDGPPKINVKRRGIAPNLTMQLGDDLDPTGFPRLQHKRTLRPAVVKVQGMEVDATGNIIYTEQVAGDLNATSGPVGKQIVTLSGPGRSDFRNYTPRVAAIQTETLSTVRSLFLPQFRVLDPVIAKAESDYGSMLVSADDSGQYPALPRSISNIGSYWLKSGEIFDWLVTEFNVVESSKRIMGWWFGSYPNTGYGNSLNYLISIGRAYAGFVSTTSGANPDYQCAIYVDFTVPTLNVDLSALTVFVHPEDQALVTPVPNLAENLFKSQDWPHIVGEIPLLPSASHPLPGSTINIRDGAPEWQSMNAMVSSTSIDLRTGLSTIAIGPSQRVAASSLISQFARPASGRIISL